AVESLCQVDTQCSLSHGRWACNHNHFQTFLWRGVLRIGWRQLVVGPCHASYYGDIEGRSTGFLRAFVLKEGFARVVRLLTQSLKLITIVALTVMVAGAGVWAFRYATEAGRPKDAGAPVMVSVFDGQTDSEVADELEAQGLIKSKMLFQGQLRLSGGALVPGTYTLRKGMSVPQIVDSITGAAPQEEAPAAAASNTPKSFDITIP